MSELVEFLRAPNVALPVEVASALLATAFDPAENRPVIVGWRAVRTLSARRDPITSRARFVIEHPKTGTIYATDIDVDIERFGYEQAWGRETEFVVFHPADPDASQPLLAYRPEWAV